MWQALVIIHIDPAMMPPVIAPANVGVIHHSRWRRSHYDFAAIRIPIGMIWIRTAMIDHVVLDHARSQEHGRGDGG
jgi:hypothetical protein